MKATRYDSIWIVVTAQGVGMSRSLRNACLIASRHNLYLTTKGDTKRSTEQRGVSGGMAA